MQNYSSQFPEYEPNRVALKQDLVLHMSFIGLYKKKQQLYFDRVSGLV